jgi:hypothetical protein
VKFVWKMLVKKEKDRPEAKNERDRDPERDVTEMTGTAVTAVSTRDAGQEAGTGWTG